MQPDFTCPPELAESWNLDAVDEATGQRITKLVQKHLSAIVTGQAFQLDPDSLRKKVEGLSTWVLKGVFTELLGDEASKLNYSQLMYFLSPAWLSEVTKDGFVDYPKLETALRYTVTSGLSLLLNKHPEIYTPLVYPKQYAVEQLFADDKANQILEDIYQRREAQGGSRDYLDQLEEEQ
jgi:hypothetical protein